MRDIRSTGGVVSTYVPHFAYSAAAMTFIAGDPGHRFIDPRAKLGFHGPTVFVDFNAADLGRELAEAHSMGSALAGKIDSRLAAFLDRAGPEESAALLRETRSKVGKDLKIFTGAELDSLANVQLLDSEAMMDNIAEQATCL
jgi:hypothetical protein